MKTSIREGVQFRKTCFLLLLFFNYFTDIRATSDKKRYSRLPNAPFLKVFLLSRQPTSRERPLAPYKKRYLQASPYSARPQCSTTWRPQSQPVQRPPFFILIKARRLSILRRARGTQTDVPNSARPPLFDALPIPFPPLSASSLIIGSPTSKTKVLPYRRR